MKKLTSLFTTIIFILGVGLYFFIVESKKRSFELVLSENRVVAPERKKDWKPLPVVKKDSEFRIDSDVKQKTSKALKYIRQKSRNPTAQSKINPESLVAHFALEGTRWKIWPAGKAILPEHLTASDKVVARMSRYVIIEVPNGLVHLNQFDRNSPTVVYNPRLKKMGIVTGLVKVETDHKKLLENAVQESNSYISNSFDQIKTYFITSYLTVFDLENLFTNLKKESFFKNIELDILDREYEKK